MKDKDGSEGKFWQMNSYMLDRAGHYQIVLKNCSVKVEFADVLL